MDSRHVAPAFALTLGIAGVLVIAWGMLLLLTLGLTLEGIGSAGLLAMYGVAVIQADRRAVTLGWTATLVMGLMTIVDPSGPLMVIVWSAFCVLAIFLNDNQHNLHTGGAARA